MKLLKRIYINYVALMYLLDEQRDADVKLSFFKRIKYLFKGFSSEKYFIYNFKKNNHKNYLSDFHRRKTSIINGKYSLIINDKILFEKLLHEKNITPKNYGTIKKGQITLFSNKLTSIKLYDFIKENEQIIFKKNFGGGGKGIYKVSIRENNIEINDKIYTPDEFDRFISGLKDYIIQEHIVQANYSNKIYNGAINSIRIVVMRDPKSNEPFIATAVHKFGSDKTKPADNVRLGGMTALVNLETGILQKPAYHENNNKKISWLDKHPDTGEKIEGVSIPNWQQVKKSIITLTKEFPFLNYVGWDVVVTNDDIKVIEGNTYTDVNILQIHKPLLIDEKIKSFYKHYKIINWLEAKKVCFNLCIFLYKVVLMFLKVLINIQN